MVTYKRIPYKSAQGVTGFRYTKNTIMTKEARIPHEVMEKFDYTDTIDYDDAPERRRCIFCDSPQSRQRYLNSKAVDLCEYHYQHVNLGKIAQQVRETEQAKVEKPIIKKKRTRKTKLSSMV